MDQPKANNPLEMLQKQKLKAIMLYIISNLKSEKRSVYFIPYLKYSLELDAMLQND